MTGEVILLLGISIACDVFGQLAFKTGASRLVLADAVSLPVFLLRLARQPWLLAGIAIYAVELVVWIRVLAVVPLGIAFPIASLNILGIVLAGRMLLGESVSRRQWVGAALITAGVAIIARIS